MHAIESLQEFYGRTRLPQEGIFTKNNGHIKVYNREACNGTTAYRRRDFYKIALINEGGTIHYADKSIMFDGPALFFSNPMIPYSWESNQELKSGYFCVFTKEFVQVQDKNHALTEAPMYKPGSTPVFLITEEQQQFLTGIFERMQSELDSSYDQKQALLYSYIQILVHEALKMEPATNDLRTLNASSRISDLFLELLERQFPIENTQQELQLKTAADYASQLSIHVNYLNHAVKEHTGKTTSGQIADRIIQEAKILLRHTRWNINEIAYSLGFEYPSYFNNFFRRHTHTTPRTFRNVEVYEKMDK